jgi:hypothetical protein
MFLESGRDIAQKIQALMDEEISQPLRLAVAFWGAGADYRLRGACKIICDLESGACNPSVIRSLLDRENCVTLKLNGLHAKVVIGSAGAVVSSANMSTNGLGAEGADSSGTIEAGYFVPPSTPDYQRMTTWFDRQWMQATPITERDLAVAEARWEFRNRTMPEEVVPSAVSTIPSFDIDPFSLLEEQVDADDRLRAVNPEVFALLKVELPSVDNRRLGKIATWACHLLLNQAGSGRDHSAGDGEARGPATDEWIVGRFGTQKRLETVASVVTLLETISRSPSFARDVRRAATRVLSVQPWG